MQQLSDSCVSGNACVSFRVVHPRARVVLNDGDGMLLCELHERRVARHVLRCGLKVPHAVNASPALATLPQSFR